MTVVDNSGDVSDSPELAITPTANPADYYDNAGISDDSNTSCADFDGDGFSYSAQALSAAGLTPGGTVSADGLTFTWPNVASCANDNILAAGQTMLVNGAAGASKLGLLESSSNGADSGPITITYTDGTSTTATLSSSDWAGGPGTRRDGRRHDELPQHEQRRLPADHDVRLRHHGPDRLVQDGGLDHLPRHQ